MQKKLYQNPHINSIFKNANNFQFGQDAWIAGGCARRLWFNEPWDHKDVDLFFKRDTNLDSFEKHLRHLEQFNVQFTSKNARTLRIREITVQLIRLNYYQSIDDLFKDFDFTICQFAYDGEYLYATDEALDAYHKRKIEMIKKTKRPLRFVRVIKYAQYGFVPSKKIMKKLVEMYKNNSLIDENLHEY